jgi:hypothetical protein
MNEEFENALEESGCSLIDVLSRNLLEWTKENHGKISG